MGKELKSIVDISDKTVKLKSLEMAKKRHKKVYITDIAIDKVPLIEYYGFTDEQNQIMQELAKNVLIISKESNNSNEVALTCDLGRPDPLHNFGVDKYFDYDKVVILFRKCIQGLTRSSPSSEVYMATLTFLAKRSEAGLYYR